MENPTQPGLPPHSAAPAARPTNTLAIVSLAAGIIGYVLPHPFIAALVAIITGHMARGQIRQTGEGGRGLATIGLVLGYVHLLLTIILLVFFFGFVAAVVAAIAHGAQGG